MHSPSIGQALETPWEKGKFIPSLWGKGAGPSISLRSAPYISPGQTWRPLFQNVSPTQILGSGNGGHYYSHPYSATSPLCSIFPTIWKMHNTSSCETYHPLALCQLFQVLGLGKPLQPKVEVPFMSPASAVRSYHRVPQDIYLTAQSYWALTTTDLIICHCKGHCSAINIALVLHKLDSVIQMVARFEHLPEMDPAHVGAGMAGTVHEWFGKDHEAEWEGQEAEGAAEVYAGSYFCFPSTTPHLVERGKDRTRPTISALSFPTFQNQCSLRVALR